MSESRPAAPTEHGDSQGGSLYFDLWGCRGSRSLIPGRSRIANFTSCYSVLRGDTLLVVDAGRGLARLGYEVMTQPRFAAVRRVLLLISHAHVDHWEGLKDADWFWQRGNGAALTVCGPEEALQSIRNGYAPPSYVPLEILSIGTAGSIDYAPFCAGDDREFAGFRIRAYGLHHYSGMGDGKRMLQALGFRIRCAGVGDATVCYLSDHEPTEATQDLEREMTAGAHLVVYDANYLEIKDHMFGHGSIEYTAGVARSLPDALVLAAHHGSTLLDDKIESAFVTYGAGAANFELAVEGASYRWDPAARRFSRT